MINDIGIKAFAAVCNIFNMFAQTIPIETKQCRTLITGSANPQLNYIFDLNFAHLDELKQDLQKLNHIPCPTLLLCDAEKSESLSKFFSENGYALIGNAQAKIQKLDQSKNPSSQHILIVEVTTPEQMHIWRSIAASNFEYTIIDDKPLFDHFLDPGPHHDKIKLYLAYLNDKPVGQSMLVLADDFAANMWSSVLPEARRNGVLTEMILYRNIIARNRGYKLSVVQCMPMSAPVYDKLGYQNAENLSLYVTAPRNESR